MEKTTRESGHKRLPEPPAIMTGKRVD